MLELYTLASGSSGNCLLMTDGTTHLLIDVGISCRRICTALKSLDINPADLSGVLITHEHTDHMSGLTTMTKQLKLPVYTSPGTGRQLCQRIAALEDHLHNIQPGASFSLGGFDIQTAPTPHDASESMCFSVAAQGRKAAVATDLGHITPQVATNLFGAHLVVVEANHDVEWVQSGPYPYFLKNRVLGEYGHLSNEAGGNLALTAVQGGARTVVLAHLSSENNTPIHAHDTVTAVLRAGGVTAGKDVTLEVAPRSELSRRYVV